METKEPNISDLAKDKSQSGASRISKKILFLGALALILVLVAALIIVKQKDSDASMQRQLQQQFQTLKSQYEEAKAKGHDISEAERLAFEAKQAYAKGDYKKTKELLIRISEVLGGSGANQPSKYSPSPTTSLLPSPMPNSPIAARDWYKEGAVYETHPYYYGANGKLSDLTAAVPSIADLGVKTIYLMPIFEATNAQEEPCNIIYNILDYKKIDSRFGNETDLKNLVEAVHANGMKIVLDMVTRITPKGSVTYNHSDWMMHMPFEELKNLAKEKDWELKYADYKGEQIVYSGGLVCSSPQFLQCELVGLIKKPSDDVIFATWPKAKGNAPDNANQGRIDYITDAAKYYVENYGIDGWRIDTPYRNWNPEVFPEDHSVLNLFRSVTSEVRKIKPDAFFMPEHPHIDPSNRPLMDEMTEASYSQYFHKKLDAGIKTSKELVDILNSESIEYDRTRARYWETHDYERIASKETAKVKPYAVLLSTIPGIPFIQAGQEIGAKNKFCSGSASKAVVNWASGDYDLRNHYKKVLSIRNSSNSLKYGDIKNVWRSGDNTYAYSRTYENETAIIVINFQDKVATSTLNLPFKSGTILFDELNNEIFTVNDPLSFKISMPPYGSRILTIKK